MADQSSPSDPSHPAARKLKLVLKTPDGSSDATTPKRDRDGNIKDLSSSPPRPSFSPVTPTHTHEVLSSTGHNVVEPQRMDEPPALPINLDDNADAIALRATISLLQMQRQQSLKNLKQLENIKKEALDDPETFVDDLRRGKLSTARPTQVWSTEINDDDNEDDDDDEDDTNDKQKTSSAEEVSKFGRLPTAQNVARCPPIEWSKYHVLGQPLEAMHEIQQRYPGVSDEHLAAGLPLRQHEMTAPYRPFVDNVKPRKSKGGYDK